MTKWPRFRLELDMNVLNHLGIGLYSSTPAVITEIIANAWDADAREVTIDIDPAAGTITIQDDGHGMDADALQNRFLRVGYARREEPNGWESPELKRPVMGRKGIGKLAMFSLSRRIDVWSHKKDAVPVAAGIDVLKLKKWIQSRPKDGYTLVPTIGTFEWGEKTGTRIVLSDLLSGIDKTGTYLRPRIARRFSILGPMWNFEVLLDGKPITPADREFQQDVQFFWTFDTASRTELEPLASSIATLDSGTKCIEQLEPTVDLQGTARSIRGFIATVHKPKQLRKRDANINQISIFANGRVFQEDVLGELGNSQVFNSYVVGEIHADFLDRDDIDRATANREAVKQADPVVVAVREKLKEALLRIALQWDEWRRQIAPEADDDEMASAIDAWMTSLKDPRDRTLADKLIKSILRIEPTNDDARNRDIKRDLLRSTIVGFEKLRIRHQLDRLNRITDVLSPEFQAIFLNADDIEATYYHDLTRTRLRIIEEFEASIVDPGELEKVAQHYLKDHLWLLDPTWSRIQGSEEIEKELTKELKRIDPAAESGARLDIVYRTSSGRHVIVELKRPGKKGLDVFALAKQGDKYRAAMKQHLREHPDLGGFESRDPPIDVFFVVEELPKASDSDAVQVLRSFQMQAFTYKGMIANARRAYHEYLATGADVSRIESIVRRI